MMHLEYDRKIQKFVKNFTKNDSNVYLFFTDFFQCIVRENCQLLNFQFWRFKGYILHFNAVSTYYR